MIFLISVIRLNLYNKKRDFNYSFANILDEGDESFFYCDIYYVNNLLIIISIVINISEIARSTLANRRLV